MASNSNNMKTNTFLFFILFSNLFIFVSALSLGSKITLLYDVNDKLSILNNTNFSANVYNKSNLWLVEFYNSWCGFCQKFAPTWKQFSTSVYAWRDVVYIGVVDCANQDNNPLCRDLEIMSYPSLRVFSPRSEKGSLGVDLKADKTISGIRQALIEVLEKDQQDSKGSPNWPNIIPYRSSEYNNIWKNVPPQVEFTFLIFEDQSSYLGREVILDYHNIRTAQVRRVTSSNEAIAKLAEIYNYPSLVVMKRDMSIIHLLPKSKTRDGYNAAIRTFLIANGGIDDVTVLKEIPKEEELFGVDKNKASSDSDKVPDVVYRADLENTLRFSLRHEIAMRKVITGDSLVALQNYLRTLASFYPTKAKGTIFLERLRDWVLTMDDAIKGEDFLEKIKQLETDIDFVIPESQEWIGCKGSEHKYRGYTCGLWTMFHALTVSAASQNKKRPAPGSNDVLKTILQYVKYFFGCEGCSKHFQDMASERKLEEVADVAESVLWLWEAHNVVNKRLKGDLTEDPNHPKIQFPASTSCFNCRDEGGDWNTNSVLHYLKERYNKNNICQVDSNRSSVCKPFSKRNNENETNSNPSHTMQLQDIAQLNGWDFNVADISLCVFLYLCSTIILVLVYVKFVVKRGARKKYGMKN